MRDDPEGYELQGSQEANRQDDGQRTTATLSFYRCLTCSATVTSIKRRGQRDEDDTALAHHQVWHREGQPSGFL